MESIINYIIAKKYKTKSGGGTGNGGLKRKKIKKKNDNDKFINHDGVYRVEWSFELLFEMRLFSQMRILCCTWVLLLNFFSPLYF